MAYVMGGMDAEDSGGPPNTGDPLGLYAGNPITVTGGTVFSGIDISLGDVLTIPVVLKAAP